MLPSTRGAAGMGSQGLGALLARHGGTTGYVLPDDWSTQSDSGSGSQGMSAVAAELACTDRLSMGVLKMWLVGRIWQPPSTVPALTRPASALERSAPGAVSAIAARSLRAVASTVASGGLNLTSKRATSEAGEVSGAAAASFFPAVSGGDA